MKSRTYTHNHRNQKGTLAAVLFCIAILIVIGLSCVAIDIAHNVHIRTKLQSASDAGALAGVVEIAKDEPDDSDIARAYEYARAVTGANEADNVLILNEDPNTSVSISTDVESDPKTVTVVASRKVNFLFPNLVQFNSSGAVSLRPDALFVQSAIASEGSGGNWLTTNSTAAPFSLQSVYPYQLVGMLPSIDHIPTKGPAKDQKIADVLDSNQPFELVWNPQNSKNVGWVKSWLHGNSTNVSIGEFWAVQNGVVNSELSKINVGDVIGIPVTSGGMPMVGVRQILGFITVEVLAKGNKEMTVKIHEPILFHGIKGTPSVSTSTDNEAFLQKWQPWTVQLIK